MLFLDGVFHADPHAGNLLLLADGQLGLLDFGQVSFAIWILHMLMDVL
jgi:predicted unusual protein kinase regulating ubiquinone biosynthesis (AarF/ABC1/UbiB family)